MKFILVYFANWDASQDLLEAKYNESYDPLTEPNPKDFIYFNENEDGLGIYEFKVEAKYPAVYSKSGNQYVICFMVTEEQEAFINSMPSAVDILAEDDNNPDTDYVWRDPENANTQKFLTVVGNDFFTGSGDPSDEDYKPPRKKLAVIY